MSRRPPNGVNLAYHPLCAMNRRAGRSILRLTAIEEEAYEYDRSTRPRRQYAPDEASDSDASGGGWVAFASVMLALVGALNLIDGIAAVADSKFFTANATFVLSDLNTLGWALIVIGSVQALTAIGVWMRTTGARWIGVAFAALNALVQLLFLPRLSGLVDAAVRRRRADHLRARRARRTVRARLTARREAARRFGAPLPDGSSRGAGRRAGGAPGDPAGSNIRFLLLAVTMRSASCARRRGGIIRTR